MSHRRVAQCRCATGAFYEGPSIHYSLLGNLLMLVKMFEPRLDQEFIKINVRFRLDFWGRTPISSKAGAGLRAMRC
jgi:hypothetical protein